MNALLMGYYGVRNLGDEMMLRCLRRWLRAQGVELTVLSEGARDVEVRHGMRAIENLPLCGQWAWRDAWLRGKARRQLAALVSHDALIVGGGDLIRDDRGWRAFLFSVEKIIAALLLHRPVYLVNIGIGVPTTGYGRRTLQWILPRCARIIVRDERTLRLCRAFGAGAVTDFAPDIVLSLPRLLDQPISGEAHGRRYALVCLRTHVSDFSQFAWTEDRVRAFAAGLDYLVEEHDLDVVFLPFQALDTTQHDNRIHEIVATAMRRRSRTTLLEWTDDVDTVSRRFSGAECVIAMRLHAAVLARAMGRRAVLMPYDYKVIEFAQLMGVRDQITAETLDRSSGMHRVLEAALRVDREVARALADPWKTLTLAGPASQAAVP